MRPIPRKEFKLSFTRSSGAGGQNINKLNTKAILTWDMKASTSCLTSIKKRFALKYKRFIFEDNVVISSQKYRTQKQNIDDCINKLMEFLSSVEFPPKARKATKPSRSSVKKRLDSKTKHSSKKKIRSEKY